MLFPDMYRCITWYRFRSLLKVQWTPSCRPFRAGVTTQGGPLEQKHKNRQSTSLRRVYASWADMNSQTPSLQINRICSVLLSRLILRRHNSSHWFFASDFLTSLYFIQGFCRHNTPQDSKHLQTLGANFIQQQAMLWNVHSQKMESKRVLTQVRHFGVIDLGSLGATWEVAQPFRKRWWL